MWRPSWDKGAILGIVAPISVILLVGIGNGAMAGLLGKNTLFSAVSGTVTDNGKPVAGARVVAAARIGGNEEHKLETVTDASGSFKLGPIERGKGLLGLLPQEFAVGQKLLISHDGKEHVGWSHSKRSPEALAETGGQEFVLACDISKEPAVNQEDQYWGVCKLVKR